MQHLRRAVTSAPSRASVLFLCLLLLTSTSGAPSIRRSALQPDASEVDLATILMKSTFRIQGPSTDGKTYFGTGFIMGRPLPNDPKRGRYVLVTSSHVFENIVGNAATINLRRFNASTDWEKLPVTIQIREQDKRIWTKHPTED